MFYAIPIYTWSAQFGGQFSVAVFDEISWYSIQLRLILRCIVWQLLDGKGFFFHKNTNKQTTEEKRSLSRSKGSHMN